jgi:hypothetical protein
MSNQSSAVASTESMSFPTLRAPGQGFWRSLFNAWVASYGNRVDPEGTVLIEL